MRNEYIHKNNLKDISWNICCSAVYQFFFYFFLFLSINVYQFTFKSNFECTLIATGIVCFKICSKIRRNIRLPLEARHRREEVVTEARLSGRRPLKLTVANLGLDGLQVFQLAFTFYLKKIGSKFCCRKYFLDSFYSNYDTDEWQVCNRVLLKKL